MERTVVDSGARPARLSARGLTVGHARRPVVSSVDLELRAGEVTVFVGPNGCGKSTLLRTLAGLLPPLAGSVVLDGTPVPALSRRALARRLGFLPQSPQAPAGVTVRELVRHGRYARRGALGRHTAEDREAIDRALALTDAEPLAGKRTDQLSGGERQRAWLATVLAQQAGILLLDEPTTYLDVRHQFEILDVVSALAHEHGMACAVVLHDLAHVAAYADQVLVVAEGTVLCSGPPADVLASDAVTRAFGVRVSLLRDPASGHLTCLPQRPTPVAV